MFFELTLKYASVGVVAVIVLWALVVVIKDRKRKAAEAEQQREAERIARDRAAVEGWRLENERRAKMRKRWLGENRPTLYYNTVDGITAVMTRESLVNAREWTAHQRMDGKWGYENLLCPTNTSCHIYVFVTQPGQEAILHRTGDFISRYKIAGFYSKLHELRKEFNVDLVQCDEIFVPWVNESVFQYHEQSQLLPNGATRNMCEELIWKQTPAELRPLP